VRKIIFILSYLNNIFSNPPTPSETVKKLLRVERAGRDIEKVLQRYVFMFTAYDEKL